MSVNRPTFKIERENLIFDSGKSASFKYPVAEAIGFDTAVLVRLDVPAGSVLNENVYGVDYDGQVLWQVPPRVYVYDDSPYTKIARKGAQALLSNWDGLELTVDPYSGSVLDEKYSK